MSNKEDTSGGALDFGVFLAAFLDIPGQQDALSNMQKLLAKSAPEPAEFDKLLSQTYLAIHKFRRYFETLVKAFYEGLCTNHTVLLGEFNPPQPKFHFFADTCIVYVRMEEKPTDKPVLQLMIGRAFLAGLAAAFVRMLGEGHPLRGSIHLGWGWELDGREIYGPAVSEAYSLERKTAQYARVVVSDPLASRLATIANNKPKARYVDTDRLIADVKGLLFVDVDGHRALDYLGKHMAELCAETMRDSVSKAREFLNSEGSRYEKERNTTQAIRTHLTQAYFLSRAQLWPDTTK